jgi:hypothetical protein
MAASLFVLIMLAGVMAGNLLVELAALCVRILGCIS